MNLIYGNVYDLIQKSTVGGGGYQPKCRAPTYYLAFFFGKLHKSERNCTGELVNGVPMGEPMCVNSLKNVYSSSRIVF